MAGFCGVHLAPLQDGVCPWCPEGIVLDGPDKNVTRLYDAKTGLVAKPTRQDAQVAAYEDPWAPAFFQPYMDFQPARGPHTLEQRTTGLLVEYYWEWGGMAVRGLLASAQCSDVIGWVVLGVDEHGEPTAALVRFLGQSTRPYVEGGDNS